jgi:hypothetical protein
VAGGQNEGRRDKQIFVLEDEWRGGLDTVICICICRRSDVLSDRLVARCI